jgi:cytochrome P450
MEWDGIIAILGGSDNTSITLSLAICFLVTNPSYCAALRKELILAFPSPGSSREGPYVHLDQDKLDSLPYLEACIQETLRLGSPYYLPRIVPKGGTTIEGNYFPESTTISLAAYSQQIDPANFSPDPFVRFSWPFFSLCH